MDVHPATMLAMPDFFFFKCMSAWKTRDTNSLSKSHSSGRAGFVCLGTLPHASCGYKNENASRQRSEKTIEVVTVTKSMPLRARDRSFFCKPPSKRK